MFFIFLKIEVMKLQIYLLLLFVCFTIHSSVYEVSELDCLHDEIEMFLDWDEDINNCLHQKEVDKTIHEIDMDQIAFDFYAMHDGVDFEHHNRILNQEAVRSIYMIIGENQNQDHIATLESWALIEPEKFVHYLFIIDYISSSDQYNNYSKLQDACKKIVEFIKKFMTSSQADQPKIICENMSAWSQWVISIHNELNTIVPLY